LKQSIGLGCLLVSFTALSAGCGSSNEDAQQTQKDSGADAKSDAPPPDAGDAASPSWGASGLDGNAIDAIAVDPKAPTTIFAGNSAGGSMAAGLYRSKDSGQSWTALTNGLTAVGCHAVAVHATEDVVLAAVGIGLYRSTDGGESWTETTNDPGGVYTVVFDPTQGKAWTVTSQNGIYASTDSGATWSNVTSTGLPALNTVGLGPLATDGAKLYLGTAGQGVYVSSDGGASFVGPGSGIPQANPDSINALAASSARPGVVFALTNADGLYRSDDSGAAWSKVTTSNPTRYAAALIDRRDSNTFYVSLDETQGGPGGLDQSSDDGASWAPLGPDTVPVAVLDQDPIDGTLYAGTVGKGVWRYGL
jgi:photosystem II stability/assembly factor-like uncharacterized protein